MNVWPLELASLKLCTSLIVAERRARRRHYTHGLAAMNAADQRLGPSVATAVR